MRAIVPRFTHLSLVVLATACGPRTLLFTAALTANQIATLVVTPGMATLHPGQVMQFQALGYTDLGTTIAAAVAWTATGGSVTTAGTYTAGQTPGWYRIIATYSGGGLADTASVHIVPSAPATAENPSCVALYEDNFSVPNGFGLISSGVGPFTVSGDPLVQATIVTPDLTAPTSPPNILQLSFLPGWKSGTSQDVALRRPLTADYYSLYLSFWVRLDTGWPGPGLGPDLAILLGSSALPGGQEVSVNLGRMVAGKLVADLRLSGLDRPFSGTTSPLLTGNIGSTPEIGAGVWHRFELLVTTNGSAPSDDGTIAWYLDGQAVGAYSGLGLFAGTLPAIRQLGWGAAAPAAALASTERVSIDHWYVSGGTSAPASGTGLDQVVLTGDTPPASTTTLYGNPTTILVDLRRNESGSDVCRNDLTVGGLTGVTASIGDFRYRRDCGRDEIVVFSVEDAAVLDRGACRSGTIWTDARGETATEQLGSPPIRVPLAIWTLNYTGVSPCPAISGNAPADDVDMATSVYNGHAAGITFNTQGGGDLCNSVTDRVALGLTGGSYSAACLKKPPSYAPGILNVYYVPKLTGGANGLQCRSVDPTIILIAEARNSTTLAHELGHAFGLEHTGDDDGLSPPQNKQPCYTDPSGAVLIGPGNLMWASGTDKKEFTLGQAFRVNFDHASHLNSSGLRLGPTSPCEPPHTPIMITIGHNAHCDPDAYFAPSRVDGTCPAVSHSW